jgi:hypothetical protein
MDYDLLGAMQDVDYVFSKKAYSWSSGVHGSAVEGGGFISKGYDDFFNSPDCSEIDFLGTILTGSHVPQVEIFEQKSNITIMAVADMSASLRVSGTVTKLVEMARCIVCIGYSAYKIGDHFGAVGALALASLTGDVHVQLGG